MPANTRRTWGVSDATDIDTLAADLTQMTWTLCTGFRLGGYLFLNDSFTEDSAQEYAVVREADGQQVESITFSWCTPTRARFHIARALAGGCTERMGTVSAMRIEPAAGHCCPLCA